MLINMLIMHLSNIHKFYSWGKGAQNFLDNCPIKCYGFDIQLLHPYADGSTIVVFDSLHQLWDKFIVVCIYGLHNLSCL